MIEEFLLNGNLLYGIFLEIVYFKDKFDLIKYYEH